MATTLAFDISRRFSGKHCDLHQQGIATSMRKEIAVVQVCCDYFKDELRQALVNHYGEDTVSRRIRFRLPVAPTPHGLSYDQPVTD